MTVSNTPRLSYTGGAGGLRAEPTDIERSAEHDQHVPVTTQQTRHIAAAAKLPALAASHNNGRPPVAATSHPAQFKGSGVVRAQPAAAEQRAAVHSGTSDTARPAARPPVAQTAAAPHPSPTEEKAKEDAPAR